MKKIIISFTLIFWLVSCEDEFPNYYWGEASALKNGQPWYGRIYALPNPQFGYGFDILIDVFNDWEFHREGLSFFKIPYSVHHNLIDTINARIDTLLIAAFYATSIGGDALGDVFKVYNGESKNYITVTAYNEITGEVRGQFAVAFIFVERGSTRSDPSAPDTIRFTKGQFHTIIREDVR